MGDVFDDYHHGAAWDEMLDDAGSPRLPYRALYDSIRRAGTQELNSGADALARSYLNQGVTFDVGGEERPFPLDIVPRVIDDPTWQVIERGVAHPDRPTAADVTWHDAARTSRRAQPHAFFTWVRERAAAINGTADATLSRDEAYYFPQPRAQRRAR